MAEFVEQLRSLHATTTSSWQHSVIEKVTSAYSASLQTRSTTSSKTGWHYVTYDVMLLISAKAFSPSPSLVRALLALSSSIRQLGNLRSLSLRRTAGAASKAFIETICDKAIGEDTAFIHDLMTLEHFARLQGWTEVAERVESRYKGLAEDVCQSIFSLAETGQALTHSSARSGNFLDERQDSSVGVYFADSDPLLHSTSF